MNDQSSNEKQENQSENKNSKERGIFKTYLHYGFNPQLGKRFKSLGYFFGHFAYLLAMVYGAVRLIQPNHPVLNPANVGKFGFRDVISTAAENVKMTRDNVDQVLIFFTVLFGLAMMILQLVGIVFLVGIDAFLSQASAQPIASLFSVSNPENDLALQALEMVFGTDMFGAGAPTLPLVGAFHAMLALFSSVALIIGIFLLIYYVFVVVSEAAMTGTPFGRRFNGLWAPIRLVVAFGLLIPVAGGLNTAQYITLYMAKMGSNLASNAWGTFSTTFLSPENFVAIPSASNMQEVVGNIFVNEVCRYTYNLLNDRLDTDGADGGIVVRAKAPVPISTGVLETLSNAGSGIDLSAAEEAAARRGERGVDDVRGRLSDLAVIGGAASGEVGGVLARGASNVYSAATGVGVGWTTVPVSAVDASSYIGQRKLNIDVHWTKRDRPNRAPDSKCGAIRFHLAASDNIGIMPVETLVAMRAAYLEATEEILTILNSGATAVAGYPNILAASACVFADGNLSRHCNVGDENAKEVLTEESSDMASALVSVAHQIVENKILDALAQVGEDDTLDELNEELTSKGWAAAGAYFNIIARINGEIYDAANDGLPSVRQEPTILIGAEAGWDPMRPRRFLASLNQGLGRLFGSDRGLLGDSESTVQMESMGKVMSGSADWFSENLEASDWESSSSSTPDGRFGRFLGNFIGDVFGAGILDMRENLSLNPLGQLAMGGKSLIARSVNAYAAIAAINIAMGLVPAVSAGTILSNYVVPLLSLLMTVGLGAGFVLYFVLPLLPFMYFLFAVAGWISEIFEAIVAMPLWALAHVRIDGDGLPGQAASTGYYLIFAIFTRPIFIVFGLIGSYAAFMVSVYLLHNLFNIAANSVDNQDGFYAGLFDSVGFTIIYVIIVYNLANTSFQMIDQVPNQIMRWFGSPASSFSDGRQVDMGSMQQFGGAAAGFLGNQLGQGAQNKINQKQQQHSQARQQAKQEKRDNKKKAEAVGRIYGGGNPKKEAEITQQAQENLDAGLDATEGISNQGGGGGTGGGGAETPAPAAKPSSDKGGPSGGNTSSGGEASGGGDKQKRGKPRTRKRRTKKPPKK